MQIKNVKCGKLDTFLYYCNISKKKRIIYRTRTHNARTRVIYVIYNNNGRAPWEGSAVNVIIT